MTSEILRDAIPEVNYGEHRNDRRTRALARQLDFEEGQNDDHGGAVDYSKVTVGASREVKITIRRYLRTFLPELKTLFRVVELLLTNLEKEDVPLGEFGSDEELKAINRLSEMEVISVLEEIRKIQIREEWKSKVKLMELRAFLHLFILE